MMQSVHLVGEEEDELYSGFNDYNEAFDTEVKNDSDRVCSLLYLFFLFKYASFDKLKKIGSYTNCTSSIEVRPKAVA